MCVDIRIISSLFISFKRFGLKTLIYFRATFFFSGALAGGAAFFSFFLANFTPLLVVTGSFANDGATNDNVRANSSDFMMNFLCCIFIHFIESRAFANNY